MGDLSELRGLLVVISFLGILVLLIGFMPYQFYTAAEAREVYIPDEWEGIDLQSYFDSWNQTSINSHNEDFDIGGRNLQWASSYFYDYLIIRHRYGIGLLFLEAGTWYNRRGIVVSYIEDFPNQQQIGATQLENDYSEYGDMQFTVKFEAEAVFHVGVHFSFNETTHSTPTEAWDNDELNVLVGIGFDEINTTFNAWDLVGMLLFFQLPEVHTVVNALIAIPIWITIAYLAYVLIIKAIPFLGD